MGMSTVVALARQAAQTAEDARIVAVRRKQQEDLAQAQQRAARAEALRAQAEAAAQTAQTQAAASQALLDQERAARRRLENQMAAAVAPPPPPPPAPAPLPAPDGPNPKTAFRVHLLEQFGAVMLVRDTPRGIVLTIPDADFREAMPSGRVYGELARVAGILDANSGLVVEVDGNERFSRQRAETVRDLLIHDGVPGHLVIARDLGDSRPIGPNPEQNRRVELTISGAPIGDMPYWARSYTLTPHK
jgi:outer membrane protein OmpA-like peptidoglycan-associated protein